MSCWSKSLLAFSTATVSIFFPSHLPGLSIFLSDRADNWTHRKQDSAAAPAARGATAAAEPEVARQPAAPAAAPGGGRRLPAAEELLQPPPASSETISLEQPSEQWLGHWKYVLGSNAWQRSS